MKINRLLLAILLLLPCAASFAQPYLEGPTSLYRYGKATFVWKGIPANATNVGASFTVAGGNASDMLDLSTSFTVIASCAEPLVVESRLSYYLNSKYVYFNQTAEVRVDDYGQPYLDGPSTLAMGQTATYRLTSGTSGELLEGLMWAYDTTDGSNSTNWGWSNNLEFISSTATSITVRNSKTSYVDNAQVTLAISSMCPNSQSSITCSSLGIRLQAPREYLNTIVGDMNNPYLMVPEGTIFLFDGNPNIYYPDVQHSWSVTSNIYDPWGWSPSVKVLTLNSPELFDRNSSNELRNLAWDPMFYDDNRCVVLVLRDYGVRELNVQHRLQTPTGPVDSWARFDIPQYYDYYGSRASATDATISADSYNNTVYPNPASSSVSIQASSKQSTQQVQAGGKMLKSQAATASTFELYSQQSGQLVKQGTYSGEFHTVDVSSLKNGIYLLKITANGQSETHRIIVQH